MKTSVIKIGNSRGVRIPKALLDYANFGKEIELELRGNKIILTPVRDNKTPKANEEALLSEAALSDWLRPEEDEAWKSLQ